MPISAPPRLPLRSLNSAWLLGSLEESQGHAKERMLKHTRNWRGMGWADSHHDNGLILSTRGSTGLQSKWRNAPASLLNTLFSKLWLLL